MCNVFPQDFEAQVVEFQVCFGKSVCVWFGVDPEDAGRGGSGAHEEE